MAKSSFISSFKRLPQALILTVGMIFVLETAVFSKAWIMADWNTMVTLHKKQMLREKAGDDVVFFGDSTLWALDGLKMHRQLGPQGSAYNYYLNDLGPAFSLSLTVMQYFAHKEKARMIFLSVKPRFFYQEENFEFQRDYQFLQFRRFMEPWLLIKNLPYRGMQDWPYDLGLFKGVLDILPSYLTSILPSYDYRIILRELGPPFLLPEDETRELFVFTPNINRYNANRQFLEYVREHRGQLMMESEEIVKKEYAGIDLPEMPEQVVNHDLERILDWTEAEEIPVIFFWMPVWDERYEAIGGNAYMEPAIRYLEALEQKYANFRVLDKKPWLYSQQNFIDVAHLNKQGYARFNKDFAAIFPGRVEEELGINLASDV